MTRILLAIVMALAFAVAMPGCESSDDGAQNERREVKPESERRAPPGPQGGGLSASGEDPAGDEGEE